MGLFEVKFAGFVRWLKAGSPFLLKSEEPIRAELFSIERLEQYAIELAAGQRTTSKRSYGHKLLPRVKQNGRVLRDAYRRISQSVRIEKTITPAAEWLVDNFFVVEDQIRQILLDLPAGFYRQLPKLAEGSLEGYPRVFGVAWAYIAHTDSRLDAEWLRRFVTAYQTAEPLQIGEIWALAISLRVVLVENLRRLADRLMLGKIARDQANQAADALLGLAGRTSTPPTLLLRAFEETPLHTAFAVQLVQRLRDQGAAVAPVMEWLDKRLAEQHTTAEEIVRAEHTVQTAMNATLRNVITSMRLLSSLDWSQFVEEVCVVDRLLREGSRFADMDFATRDSYRHAVEELSRGCQQSESEVVGQLLQAMESARQKALSQNAPAIVVERVSDPGYHLISKGRSAFEKTLGFRLSLRHRAMRLYAKHATAAYLGSLALATSGVMAIFLYEGHRRGLVAPVLSLFGFLAVIPASDLAVAVVNRWVMRSVRPRRLPKLNFETGIPAAYPTLVVIPTLLIHSQSIQEALEHLEVHFLSNPQGPLQFALLSDWSDASQENMPQDDALLSEAVDGIHRLNHRHGPGPGGLVRFMIFHRRRVWNAQEKVWMGWERKRGKLHELNQLLRGETRTSFVGGLTPMTPLLRGVRYVITLDSDTRMARGAAYRLVATMAHPLNCAYFSPQLGRVVEGYGVIQPRITPVLPGEGAGSVYQRTFSGPSGVDPYAFAVSDVYQDLFKEGSYVGKGIYDIDAFESALHGRVPENRMLSHDLFEGVYARTALATDIEFFEEFPSHYPVAVSRMHRWIRGDWQLLIDLTCAKSLPFISQWKMVDNLRRSLSPIFAFLMLACAWSIPGVAAVWATSFIMAVFAIPQLFGSEFKLAFLHILLAVLFLAHQAWVAGDAIVRTLFRLFISHRHLLEWTSAAEAYAARDYRLARFYGRMSGALWLAGVTGLAIFLTGRPWDLPGAFLVGWFFSPWIAWRISLPGSEKTRQPLTRADETGFRLVARQTWRFFETFVNESTNHLPPDNFQEEPHPVVAQRTSPTNIGLYFLSVVTARDLGWLGLVEMVERLEATVATLKKLPRHRGHFFNWYDTSDLRALEPLYISTVDSGNLSGHLAALAEACRRMVKLDDVVPLSAMPSGFADVLLLVKERLRAAHKDNVAKAEFVYWIDRLHHQIKSHQRDLSVLGRGAHDLVERLNALARWAEETVQQMEFGFLLDPAKKIFSIGYQVTEKKLDPSFYDLLASEARLASFMAIAKGDVPASHWFHLGRSLTSLPGGPALLSWSGSMFEYLMPLLVMRSPAGSLLDQTYRCIVARQRDYGRERDVPWGISESGYSARDIELTYQYSNFGVPGLGLKRGLSDDLLISPYATCLAAMVDPAEAAKNLRRLAAVGAQGRYGFYEALDYTYERLPENEKVAVVRAYMAHHQGMCLVSLGNVLCQGLMRERFHANPQIQATELLLQERTPRNVPVARPGVEELHGPVEVRDPVPSLVRRFNSPHQPTPRTHLLSNGRYSVMLTPSGSGYSRWRGLAVTRWREDATRDPWGTYVYLRDVESGKVWSASYQPTGAEPDDYEVDFSEERAEFVRRDGSLITTLEVIVSPEDDAEIRRVTLRNVGGYERVMDVTSYAEMVLTTPATDNAHPAFSNLFVQTEFVSQVNGLICSRRVRQPTDEPVWAAHVIVVDGNVEGPVQYESDRAHFLGRGRGTRSPGGIFDGKPLTNTTGAVLDPVVSLRQRLRIAPGESVHVSFITLIAPSREHALVLADKYHDPTMFERTATLAWTHAQVQQHYLGIEPREAHLFQDLASRILYSDAAMRPSEEVLKRNRRAASGLWPYGISGDLPIVLVRIDEVEDCGIIRQLLRAYEYWHMKNLAVDLVIVNEKGPSYIQELQTSLDELIQATQTGFRQVTVESPGRLFLLRADRISPEDRILLQTAARVVLLSRQGSLSEQVARVERLAEKNPPPRMKRPPRPPMTPVPLETADLEFFNGLGGFSADGREYVTVLGPGQWTPAPWINVISNPSFGFQVSESGAGYTWSENSRENQLTPWSNDPVGDPSGETFYIRDMESGVVWTPTALPIREEACPYVARHGQGYSVFEHQGHDLDVKLLQYVPRQDSIKISRLTMVNRSRRSRTLSVTAYLEWALGFPRSTAAPFIVTERDPKTGALIASNAWNGEFAGRIAFADLGGAQTSWTADRREFLGRHGTLDYPLALASGRPLSGKVGAGLDPCAALQAECILSPGEHVEIVLFLGQTATHEEAIGLIERYRRENLDSILLDVKKQWEDVLENVQVRTPERSMDILVNHWLLYQTLSCRIWSRSGFYQAGGAFGFRDQLQDSLAFLVCRPDMVRRHILLAASRQFPEGDVQHWWHPPSGRGVRTRISDDLLWLPYVVNQYVDVTQDPSILEEIVPFLESQPIPEGREDAYFQPNESAQKATLFDHCARALDKSLSVGTHGLPLIGTGDWNDGMNRIGSQGHGESVWLGWFLHTTLWEFAKFAEKRGESAQAERWRLHVGDLKAALEKHGWDQDWYRRAYYDDGTPVGSAAEQECRIDSIAQSWGVLSGAADPARAQRAMAALEEHLIKREDRLVLLLTPPFDKTPKNPGYIKGYLPGVRENGGQYTHAGVWATIALASLGQGDKAMDLFNLLNPINHGSRRADIHRYKVEPYVMAGDVYSASAHIGRGGWTWYTGSAGWMYRAAVEWILGFRLRGTTLILDPCIPKNWPQYELTFRYHSARYDIRVENPQSVCRGVRAAEMDGVPIRTGAAIHLKDDNALHHVRIVLG